MYNDIKVSTYVDKDAKRVDVIASWLLGIAVTVFFSDSLYMYISSDSIIGNTFVSTVNYILGI